MDNMNTTQPRLNNKKMLTLHIYSLLSLQLAYHFYRQFSKSLFNIIWNQKYIFNGFRQAL